ncbi:hypothetical protein [Glutamicibacter sp.]|jgi:hypothetical protein|uniref:hypothetical protein n=1 Tax=Glutamicibacter sp. TaxID=1931995 RepID=UPI002B4979B7|nr:hypothetical protein [Glutamicibacter sp.]HJX80118.1 hypothetical protein [Glutamicibacter sp.]
MSSPTINAPVSPQNPPPAGSKSSMTLVLAILGALIILGVIATSAWRASNSLGISSSEQTANAQGVTALDVQVDAGRFNLLFADIPEATLEVDSARSGEWTLRREAGTLLVRSPNDWGDWCFVGCDWEENDVTLTLPSSLNDGNLDAELQMAAGEFSADGNFNDLLMEMSGGTLDVSGSAKGLFVELGAGKTDIDMANVQIATFDISAGRVDGAFTGTAPKDIQAQVSAGMLQLTLPDTSYNVIQDVSAGAVENGLSVSQKSEHKVQVEVSAGNVVLRAGAEPTNEKK